jgi:signal transduction histidine kinase
MNPAAAPSTPPPPPEAGAGTSGWQRFASGALRAFHAYASWLVSISWKRFLLLSFLLLVFVGIVHDLPPFTWKVTEQVTEPPRTLVVPPRPPAPPKPDTSSRQGSRDAPREPAIVIEAPGKDGQEGVDIAIGRDGIRIVTRRPEAVAEATAAAEAAAREAERAAEVAAETARTRLAITLPPGTAEEVRRALDEARTEIEEAVREARSEAEQALREAAEARREAGEAAAELSQVLTEARPRTRTRTVRYGIGDALMQFTWMWVIASMILKIVYKGRVQAEAKAAQATETAEAESLKRQVVEARMAAMQAQVEPHFLFNTLASIDHLIETDPPRASQMQKNLIALLRASMPTMREAGGSNGNGVRELGREVAVIRPYLEILKVRMEERLATEIDVPEGLLSAEFPPMMIQTLVENAIKHGLEPKAEGGLLRVSAQIVHGKLQVTVADTGLGFGRAATAGTGVGLANVRERLQLLYGREASLTVAENRPSGTVVTITVPYKTVASAVAGATA